MGLMVGLQKHQQRYGLAIPDELRPSGPSALTVIEDC
jgi:hypothetical protein